MIFLIIIQHYLTKETEDIWRCKSRLTAAKNSNCIYSMWHTILRSMTANDRPNERMRLNRCRRSREAREAFLSLSSYSSTHSSTHTLACPVHIYAGTIFNRNHNLSTLVPIIILIQNYLISYIYLRHQN